MHDTLLLAIIITFVAAQSESHYYGYMQSMAAARLAPDKEFV